MSRSAYWTSHPESSSNLPAAPPSGGAAHVSPGDVQAIAAGGDQRPPPLAGGLLSVELRPRIDRLLVWAGRHQAARHRDCGIQCIKRPRGSTPRPRQIGRADDPGAHRPDTPCLGGRPLAQDLAASGPAGGPLFSVSAPYRTHSQRELGVDGLVLHDAVGPGTLKHGVRSTEVVLQTACVARTTSRARSRATKGRGLSQASADGPPSPSAGRSALHQPSATPRPTTGRPRLPRGVRRAVRPSLAYYDTKYRPGQAPHPGHLPRPNAKPTCSSRCSATAPSTNHQPRAPLDQGHRGTPRGPRPSRRVPAAFPGRGTTRQPEAPLGKPRAESIRLLTGEKDPCPRSGLGRSPQPDRKRILQANFSPGSHDPDFWV